MYLSRNERRFEFANRLEYALGIPASFGMNLQSNYDKEVFEINSLSNIEEKELNILKDLKDVIKFCENAKIVECNFKKERTVLNMRKFLNLNNLCSIPSLSIQQAAFRGSKANKVNVYVLYAWQKLCEYFTNFYNKNMCDIFLLQSSFCYIYILTGRLTVVASAEFFDDYFLVTNLMVWR